MTETIPPVPILCACGNLIAEEIYIEGYIVIHMGHGLLHDAHGSCDRCGQPFDWSIKGHQLQKAIVKARQGNPEDE